MKTQIYTYLLLFLVPVQTLAGTDCKIVEFTDRTEVICIGDEITRPVPTVPEKPLRAVTADNVTQIQVVAPQMPEPVPAAAMAQSPIPFGTATAQTHAPANAAKKAAEDLAKRRELATRNTLNLKSYTSATTLPAK